MRRDIIDAIDELVDDQLAEGEPEVGYNFGDPQFPRCPHCDRHWHGLPITRKIAEMYSWGQFDPDYLVAEDDSAMLCEGSEFIGPRRPTDYEARAASWGSARGSVTVTIGRDDTFSVAMERMQRRIQDMYAALMGLGSVSFPAFEFRSPGRGLGVNFQAPWVIYDEAWTPIDQPSCPGPPPEIDVKFGPENWHLDFQYTPAAMQFPTMHQRQDHLSRSVRSLWNEFHRVDIPGPASPGYDFSGYNEELSRGPERGRLDGVGTR